MKKGLKLKFCFVVRKKVQEQSNGSLLQHLNRHRNILHKSHSVRVKTIAFVVF